MKIISFLTGLLAFGALLLKGTKTCVLFFQLYFLMNRN